MTTRRDQNILLFAFFFFIGSLFQWELTIFSMGLMVSLFTEASSLAVAWLRMDHLRSSFNDFCWAMVRGNVMCVLKKESDGSEQKTSL